MFKSQPRWNLQKGNDETGRNKMKISAKNLQTEGNTVLEEGIT